MKLASPRTPTSRSSTRREAENSGVAKKIRVTVPSTPETRARLHDAPEGQRDVALVHGEVLGELPDDQLLGLPGGEHESHHGHADEDQRESG